MMKNVLVVPKFGRSIMSINLMQRNGSRYTVDFTGARLEGLGGTMWFEQINHDKMYYLVGDIIYPKGTPNIVPYFK